MSARLMEIARQGFIVSLVPECSGANEARKMSRVAHMPISDGLLMHCNLIYRQLKLQRLEWETLPESHPTPDILVLPSRIRKTVTQQLNEPAIDTFKEIRAFLSANPSEIVTMIIEDHVKAPNGLTKAFDASGLRKYWFPMSQMPQNGRDWPLVRDMVAKNQRLIVFTSDESKQKSERIAYQWNYIVESQYGDGGIDFRSCHKREESAPLHDKKDLIDMLHTCYKAAGNRWANFVAVDYYKRSDGGGSFQAIDTLNGKLLCGCNDVHASWFIVRFLRTEVGEMISEALNDRI
ncbi:PLC-like phosphodiesterases superfamily protein [Actinidia rufa]|uniref:PLC-like phosphodiesterases superfamily protein n=1 Tax=Actinidia rufa TaxID=165716 RepID=A0A7J0EQZ2_9ERIC|nr:PLC-like phosphodiesterases superfamily protein [Actinidia rufa]